MNSNVVVAAFFIVCNLPAKVIVMLHKDMMRKESNSSIHYVVSGPSLMQDLPQVSVKTMDKDRSKSMWSQVEEEYRVQSHMCNDFGTVELVYGRAGE